MSDIILLGTEAQVELAARAAMELAAGRPVHTDELVASLRDFIREVLDLEPVSRRLAIPKQGPARPTAGRLGKADSDEKDAAIKGDKSVVDSSAGQGQGMAIDGDEHSEHHR